jgi:hypothetical protein
MPPTTIDSPFAWRMAAVAFAVGFIVFGIVYSFSVFLDPIMADLKSSRTTTSALYAMPALRSTFWARQPDQLGIGSAHALSRASEHSSWREVSRPPPLSRTSALPT